MKIRTAALIILLFSAPAIGNVKKCQQRGWSEEDCERIGKHQVWVGMTAEMLSASWGKPKETRLTTEGKTLTYKRLRVHSPMESPLPIGADTVKLRLEGKDCDGRPAECKVIRIEQN